MAHTPGGRAASRRVCPPRAASQLHGRPPWVGNNRSCSFSQWFHTPEARVRAGQHRRQHPNGSTPRQASEFARARLRCERAGASWRPGASAHADREPSELCRRALSARRAVAALRRALRSLTDNSPRAWRRRPSRARAHTGIRAGLVAAQSSRLSSARRHVGTHAAAPHHAAVYCAPVRGQTCAYDERFRGRGARSATARERKRRSSRK